MTNEEAIAIIEHRDDIMDYCESRQLAEALDVAVEALKAEPCEDCISRKAVLNCKQTFHDNAGYETEYVDVEDIKSLTPVIPKPTECEDAVSRMDVISIVQDIDMKSDVYEALRLIKELPSTTPKIPTNTDCVSREAIDEIKELMTDINGDTVYAVRMSDIRQLPPVTPKQRTGQWIMTSDYPLDNDK